jgi:hypothetical protein
VPITATSRPTWGAVELDVDLSAVSLPWYITVTRTNNVTLEAVIVRSGDLVVSPGGIVTVYDFEAPLNTSLTYSAQAYTYVGATTGAATTTTITSPNTTSSAYVWLKSFDNPSLSRQLTIANIGFLTRKRTQAKYQPLGVTGGLQPKPIVHSFGLAAREGPLEVNALTWADIDGLGALSVQNFGLVQFDPALHITDMFVAYGDVAPNVHGPRAGQAQTWTINLTEIARPSTVGYPLMIPGVSWTSTAAAFASYTALAAARTNWLDVADG